MGGGQGRKGGSRGEEKEMLGLSEGRERMTPSSGGGRSISTCLSSLVTVFFSMQIYLPMYIHVCVYVCMHVCACPLASSIAAEYPGDIEQSLQQPSAVNERMESTAYPLNSLSLYWTWRCRLIIGLSHRYFGWLIWVLIKKRRRWQMSMCVDAIWGKVRTPAEEYRKSMGWSVKRLIRAVVRKSVQTNLIKAVVYVVVTHSHSHPHPQSLFLFPFLLVCIA